MDIKDKGKRRDAFLKHHPDYYRGNTTCLHCSRLVAGGSRGLCASHYHQALKLSKEYSWDELVKRGVCTETRFKKGSIFYDELKDLMKK